MTVPEYGLHYKAKELLHKCRESRKLVLIIVAIALLLDNMLLTTIVPIIPEFIYAIHHKNDVTTESPLPLNSSAMEVSTNATNTFLEPLIAEHGRIAAGSKNYTVYVPQTQKNNSDVWTISTTILTYYGGTPRGRFVCYDKDLLPSIFQNSATLTTTPEPEDEDSIRHRELIAENFEVGIMFASKAIVQLITNPFVGPLTNRVGYSIPMFCGFVIMFLSTIIFAFGRSYAVLFAARSLQGLGSSCSSVSGMGMLADRYPDDEERGNAMGFALGGLALGVLIGPPFGGAMYQFVGKSAPFLILAGLALGDGLLQLLVLQPAVKKQHQEGASLLELLKDPYIIIAAGAITFANIGIAMLEPSLPIHMMDTMKASKWEQGAAFLPASISYLIGTNLFGPLGHKIGRWLASFLGLIIIGICLIFVPSAKNIYHLIAPNAGLGFAIGMVDSSMMPHLGFLVDIRHAAVYGSVYAIGDVAFCLGFAIGPAMSGSLVKAFGFAWMLYGIAVINFLYAPLMFYLRNPPVREEQQSLIVGKDCTVRYVTYNPDGVAADADDGEWSSVP